MFRIRQNVAAGVADRRQALRVNLPAFPVRRQLAHNVVNGDRAGEAIVASHQLTGG